MSKTIELTDRQAERFEEIKAECEGGSLPKPTDEVMLTSLLDTWDAVGRLYTEGTPNDELRALVEQWREKQEDCTLPRSGLTGEGDVYRTCADELEEVIEE